MFVAENAEHNDDCHFIFKHEAKVVPIWMNNFHLEKIYANVYCERRQFYRVFLSDLLSSIQANIWFENS